MILMNFSDYLKLLDIIIMDINIYEIWYINVTSVLIYSICL